MKQSKNYKIEASSFDLQQYLKRINFQGEIKLNLDGIKKLMQSQIFNVPFENIDVQAGKTISLIGDDIVNQIVDKNRGGYCYQINGIFSLMLQEIGIPHYYIAVRPLVNPIPNAKTHLAIIATIENEEYLIDLGFGGNSIREPLKLSKIGTEVKQDFETFTLIKTEEDEYLLQMQIGKEWSNLYSFDLNPQRWIDFKPANHYNYSHPDSVFTQNLIVVLQNPLGKKILFKNSIKTVTNGITEIVSFEENQLENILETEFNLKV
ncbi:arylamine N-acetyltransferase [Flavobacterium sp. ANB]|uniref:arylamine N-acetyltransferase family protein n=1 Tax=unclassified Flavobacterium TaxID=196869 RepID=UPI0012B8D323|nr:MULTISPECIES: arylamine N-acetyltransferase [unclassified Flavobacterium]MBF4519299.1 arylamine N-acetyltransferase [Flavobacterium sp. ANB]MTD72242.1 arylamine N-acetyltransferase [Flavobacterium sp. LC2016-13]